MFFFQFVSAVLLPVLYQNHQKRGRRIRATMNDKERNTLLLLCAMFHFFLCPWDSCRRRAATAVVEPWHFSCCQLRCGAVFRAMHTDAGPGFMITASWPLESGAQRQLHDRVLPLTSHVRTTTTSPPPG